MNFLGNPIEGGSLAGGGEINGNLDINGDLLVSGDGQFENLNVIDTLTANTIISVEELEVKDPIITMGAGNTGDLLNMGFLEELDDGVQKWAGLLRWD